MWGRNWENWKRIWGYRGDQKDGVLWGWEIQRGLLLKYLMSGRESGKAKQQSWIFEASWYLSETKGRITLKNSGIWKQSDNKS